MMTVVAMAEFPQLFPGFSENTSEHKHHPGTKHSEPFKTE